MSLRIAELAVKAAEEKKGTRVVLLDVKGRSDLCDYQVICSAENERQARAIADHIEALCKESFSVIPAAIEGKKSGAWILLDYGSTIIHIFLGSLREFYSLEDLWGV